MTFHPQVSIIIPTHNRAHVLPRAIQSVLNQNYTHWELIVVDDGSEDHTLEVIQSLKKYFSNKNPLRLLTLPTNSGVSYARNRGVEMSLGTWISFLDSDDEWLEDKLQKQVELLAGNPDLKAVHGEEIWIRKGVRVNQMKKHQKSGGRIFSRCLALCLISPSSILMEKNLYWELGGMREDFPVCEDYDLWLKLTAGQEIGFIPTPIIKKHGGHSDQLSTRYKAMDYYRVLALFDLFKNPELQLNQSEKDLLRLELNKKSKILLNGYKKHQNMQHYDEIEKIFLLSSE